MHVLPGSRRRRRDPPSPSSSPPPPPRVQSPSPAPPGPLSPHPRFPTRGRRPSCLPLRPTRATSRKGEGARAKKDAPVMPVEGRTRRTLVRLVLPKGGTTEQGFWVLGLGSFLVRTTGEEGDGQGWRKGSKAPPLGCRS